jgi:hypothetical protein
VSEVIIGGFLDGAGQGQDLLLPEEPARKIEAIGRSMFKEKNHA